MFATRSLLSKTAQWSKKPDDATCEERRAPMVMAAKLQLRKKDPMRHQGTSSVIQLLLRTVQPRLLLFVHVLPEHAGPPCLHGAPRIYAQSKYYPVWTVLASL